MALRPRHRSDASLPLLYVREALGLDVAEAMGIPPRLAGDVPNRASLLDADARRDAARDWPAWWHDAVAAQARTQLEPPDANTEGRLREIAARHRMVADPPEWSSLSARPALRYAVRNLYVEACRWFNPARQPFLPPARRDVFAWELVRDIAEATAVEHEVSVAVINGCALVLIVEGSWWEAGGSWSRPV